MEKIKILIHLKNKKVKERDPEISGDSAGIDCLSGKLRVKKIEIKYKADFFLIWYNIITVVHCRHQKAEGKYGIRF